MGWTVAFIVLTEMSLICSLPFPPSSCFPVSSLLFLLEHPGYSPTTALPMYYDSSPVR